VEESSRQGDGRVHVVDFRVSPDPPHTGEPVEFTITVVPRSPDEAVRTEAEIALYSQQGTPILQVRSRHMGHDFVVSGSGEKIMLRLPELPLVPGRYPVSLFLGRGDYPIDWVRNAFTLLVMGGEFVDGELIPGQGFPVALPAEWTSSSV
jgi:hypothetical protein